MQLFETTHKKKSAAITLTILSLMILAILNLGMQYLDPPEEYGLAINFGDSNVGSGDPVVKTKAQPVVKQQEKEEEQKEVIETPKEAIQEDVVTQETKEAPVIQKPKEKKVEKPVEVVKKIEPKVIPKPKPSKATQDALNSLLNGNATDGKPKGEGDDAESGVKGDKKGDQKSTSFYGNNGSDGDSNYNLAGREALSKPIEKPDCNEEGIVVVRIEVDNNGKVIKAVAGVKGTTNSAPCLLKPARIAALKTTWSPNKDAPAKQTGTIIYRFSLSE